MNQQRQSQKLQVTADLYKTEQQIKHKPNKPSKKETE